MSRCSTGAVSRTSPVIPQRAGLHALPVAPGIELDSPLADRLYPPPGAKPRCISRLRIGPAFYGPAASPGPYRWEPIYRYPPTDGQVTHKRLRAISPFNSSLHHPIPRSGSELLGLGRRYSSGELNTLHCLTESLGGAHSSTVKRTFPAAGCPFSASYRVLPRR